MEHNPLLYGFVAVSRSVLCWCSAFWLFTLADPSGLLGFDLIPFLAGALLCLLLVRWFLSHERSLLSVIIFSAAIGAALSVLLIWKFSNLRHGSTIFLGLVAVGSTVYIAVQRCMEPPTPAGSITAMELTTLFLVLFLWFQASSQRSALYSVPLLAAVLLSLVETSFLRLSNSSGDTGRQRGVLILTAVLAVIFLLLGLFVAFGAEPLSEGVLYLISASVALCKWLLAQIERFFLWLLRFFPDSPVEEAALSYEIPALRESEAAGEANPVMLVLMLVVLAALILCFLIQVVRMLARRRVGEKKRLRIKSSTVQREKLRLLKWLQRLLVRLGAYLRLRANLLSMRGTPQELFYFLCRSGKRLNYRRGRGETPAAFLGRMAVLSEGDRRLQEGLACLAGALNECLYAPRAAAVFPPDTARYIRRQFRKALRHARRRQFKAWVDSLRGKVHG